MASSGVLTPALPSQALRSAHHRHQQLLCVPQVLVLHCSHHRFRCYRVDEDVLHVP